MLDLTSGEIQAHREGEAPAEPQERKTLSKKAQQELRPPEGLATKQFFCNAGVYVSNIDPSSAGESPNQPTLILDHLTLILNRNKALARLDDAPRRVDARAP